MDTLRYADAPPVEVDVLVKAPVAAVWRLVADLQTPARFSTEFQGAEWLGEPGLGSQFLGRSSHPALGEWQTTCTVIEYEPDRTFAYRIGSAETPSARWRYSLSPEGDGTRLRFWMRMGPGWSGLCNAIERMPEKEHKIVARRLEEFRTNMIATLTGIKGLAEGTL